MIPAAYWVVEEVEPTSDARKHGPHVHYRLHVRGRNLGTGREERFGWSVHDVADPRYDLSSAKIDPAAVPFLGRAQ